MLTSVAFFSKAGDLATDLLCMGVYASRQLCTDTFIHQDGQLQQPLSANGKGINSLFSICFCLAFKHAATIMQILLCHKVNVLSCATDQNNKCTLQQ